MSIDIKKLKESVSEVSETLKHKAKELVKIDIGNPVTVDIDLQALPEFKLDRKPRENIYRPQLMKISPSFHKVCNEYAAAVYVFSLPKNHDREKIIQAIKKCKSDTGRTVPSLDNIDGRKYDVLYVGSYKSHFYGRFMQHLGYSSSGTGALQLIHWDDPGFSKIRLTYFPFPFSEFALHTQMEIAMCKTVTPMIGKMETDRLKMK